MIQGTLKKMITEYKNPINYFLNMDKGFVHLNQHIGKKLNISHIGSECLSCSKEFEIFFYLKNFIRYRHSKNYDDYYFL